MTIRFDQTQNIPNADVVHVIDSLLGWGGAENRLVDEVLSMPELDHVVVRIFEGDVLDSRLTAVGVPVIALGLSKSRESLAIPLGVKRLRRVVARARPGVIHTSLTLSNLIGQLAATTFVPRIPVVSTLTRAGDRATVEHYFSPSAPVWKARMMRTAEALVGRRSHVSYRAVANHVKWSSVEGLGIDPRRVSVIPRGLRVKEPVEPAQHRALLGASGRPLFVNVGRLSISKGQGSLLRAFKEVLGDLPDAILAIAGEGQDAEQEITRIITGEGMDKSVRLLGYEPEVTSLMAAADVVLVSSLTEGLPGAVLEAMSSRSPIVAYDIPGTREATDDGAAAELVPAGDELAFAAAAVSVFCDADRRKELVDNGWVLVQEKFNLSVTARELSKMLSSAASRSLSHEPHSV